MTWRVAKSLLIYRWQIDLQFPGRKKGADGTIGDVAHQQQQSDHNVDNLGVVRALDITNDPASGCDTGKLWEHLRVSRDQRIKYAIANRRIFSSYEVNGVPAFVWRPYGGSDPHDNHGHLSVVSDSRADDERLWSLGEVVKTMSEFLEPLTQGTPGYAGQLRDTALAFAWQHSAEANHAAHSALEVLARIEGKLDILLSRSTTVLTVDDRTAIVEALQTQLSSYLDTVLQNVRLSLVK